MRLSKLQAILLGGLIAGTIDIGAASLISGRDPTIIAQFIAGGLLGNAALTGEMQTVALGVVLQWAMSLIIAAIYVFASGRLVALRRRWLLCGILYGVPVYFTMTYVVVPLSAWHRVTPFSLVPFAENLAAMMVFGLIVAWFASRTDAR
jgi:uncharacterized membrane protein YagU involved in acid resistance